MTASGMAPPARQARDLGLSPIVDGRAGVRAGDGKTLRNTRGQIAGAESDQLLIGVDLINVTPGEALGGENAAGKADQNQAGGGPEQVTERSCIEGRQD